MKNIIVTGGLGFIGSALVRKLIETYQECHILLIDNFSYAYNDTFYQEIKNDIRVSIFNTNITNADQVRDIFRLYNPVGIFHLAAESHVDNSITGSRVFMQTNIMGTWNLLEQSRKYVEETGNDFRFLYVSTDEVYGDLPLDTDQKFHETNNLKASSPYSASKAAGDLLVNAWFRTYKLPTLITHCSNNYGPYQHREKLIPKIISNILEKKPIPVYGEGKNVRDWIYVDDHVDGLIRVFLRGTDGETYNIGTNNQINNINIVNLICQKMQNKLNLDFDPKSLITFVEDRKGHDLRYAIDNSKVKTLGWQPKVTFEKGIEKTIDWFIMNSQNNYIKQ